MTEIPLRKPTFSKVNDISPARHCYNIYGKIVEAHFSEKEIKTGHLRIVDGVIGDETGCAKFKLIGENAQKVVVGKVYAFRNGLSSVVDEHILLELDRFGRITEEPQIEIREVNTKKNISQVAYEKKVQN